MRPEVPSREHHIRYMQAIKDRMEHRLTLDTHIVTVPSGAADDFDHDQN